MSIFSNRRIKTASKNRSKIDLSSRVITTNDFGFVLPIFSREVIPGDHLSFDNIKAFARLAPMPVPTYAGVKMVQRAFYVRYRSVWKAWDDFFAGRDFYKQDGTSVHFDSVPTITNLQIVRYFIDSDLTIDSPSSVVPDFTIDDSGTTYRFRFSNKGRKVYSVLLNLGYKINFALEDTTSFSVLPLLCYFKVFYDYILPSKYTNDSPFRSVFETIDFGTDYQSVLSLIAEACYCLYDNDYFTASWNNPNTPNTSSAVSANIWDPSIFVGGMTNGVVLPKSNGFEAQLQAETTLDGSLNKARITQFGIDALKRVYDWGMRKGLAGNRYFEDIFAQFGIKLPDVQVDRSVYLGSSEQFVQISDVMSTSQTSVNGNITAVGDYAGKGIIFDSSKGFSVDCNDFGQVIVLSTILPETGYVQGRNREILHKTRLDFFNPEFDCLGMQPVRNDELFASYRSTLAYDDGLSYGGKPDGIFGFAPRYSEYKKGYDLLSGDFFVPHLKTGMDSYHSFRMFDEPAEDRPLNNNLDFRTINPTNEGSNFNRIFNVTNSDQDHFICVFNIPCFANRKMASIKDSFELDGGPEVTVDPDCQLH